MAFSHDWPLPPTPVSSATVRSPNDMITIPISRGSDGGFDSDHEQRSRGYSTAPTAVGSSRRSTLNNERRPSNVSFELGKMPGQASTDRLCTQCRDPIHADMEHAAAVFIEDEKDLKLVGWDGPNDPAKPQNWPKWKKWTIVTTTAFMTLTVSFASSVFSTAVFVTADEFHVSSEVMTLGVALYVLGFAFGPMVWGPASELYGRTTPLFIGMFAFCIFQIPVALAQNLETIFICRFFGGVFGSAPLAILAGLYVDMIEPLWIGVAVSIFAAGTFMGPALGPIIGSFVTYSKLGWRWTAWITLIMGAFFTTICYIATPETMEAVLLRRKAQKLRIATKDFALHAKAEEEPNHFGVFVTKYLTKPVRMLLAEPILVIVTIYSSLVYGILYLTFEAFPIAFINERGWSPRIGSLPFIGLLLGIMMSSVIMALWSFLFVSKRFAATKKLNPEDRLPTMIIGSFLLPIGLFWFAWTSDPSISWVPQVIAGGFIGCGIILVFMSAMVYIIDVYLFNANSANAINTFIRSSVGASFPLFASYMFQRLGVNWGASVLGFACVALIPFPIIFYIYGRKIRSWSKFAIVLPGT